MSATVPRVLVPFGWRPFLHKYRLMLRREPQRARVAGQFLLRLGLLGVGQTGWALDAVFHRRWQHMPVERPVFILGHQRSGTTFVHRRLAGPRALTLQEMIFPAVSTQRLIAAAAQVQFLRRRFERWQEKRFAELDRVHRLRFDEIEEDEFVFWTIFASGMCVNDAPSSTELDELDHLRHFASWPEARRSQALGWYRACLAKKAYRLRAAGLDSAGLVSKNPAFTHKIPELRATFPDARFVLLVRNPLQAIPSRLSLIREIWRLRFPGFGDMTGRQVRVIYEDSLRTYLSPETHLDDLPEEARIRVRFEDLVAEPGRVLDDVCRTFDLPDADPDAEPVRSGKPRHRYGLDEFGLSPEQVRADLAPVFERYGFEDPHE